MSIENLKIELDHSQVFFFLFFFLGSIRWTNDHPQEDEANLPRGWVGK